MSAVDRLAQTLRRWARWPAAWTSPAPDSLVVASDGRRYGDGHHMYEGPDFGDCLVCGADELAFVHMSFEDFSRDCDGMDA